MVKHKSFSRFPAFTKVGLLGEEFEKPNRKILLLNFRPSLRKRGLNVSSSVFRFRVCCSVGPAIAGPSVGFLRAGNQRLPRELLTRRRTLARDGGGLRTYRHPWASPRFGLGLPFLPVSASSGVAVVEGGIMHEGGCRIGGPNPLTRSVHGIMWSLILSVVEQNVLPL